MPAFARQWPFAIEETPMSIYDILMLIIFVGSILFGAWKGLAWQVASLSAIVVSYLVAINFGDELAAFLQADPPWNKFGAMLILFLGTSLVIWMIFGRVRESIKKMHLASFDRQAGALLGAVKGALLCMVVTMFGVALLGNSTAEAICFSKSGGYITRGINQLSAVVPDEIHGVLAPYIDKFNQALQQEHQGHDQAPFSNQFEFPQSANTSGDHPVPAIYGGQQSAGQLPSYNGQFNPIQTPQNNQNYQTYNGQWQRPAPPQNQYPNQSQAPGQFGYSNQPSQAQNPPNWQTPNYGQPGSQGSYPTAVQPNGSGTGWPTIQIDSQDLINAGSEVIRDAAKQLWNNDQNR
jgi:membrane protein required for colicin V production